MMPAARRHVAPVVAVLLLAALVSCGTDSAEVGDAVEARPGTKATGSTQTVVLPVGTVSVAVGSPREQVPDGQAVDRSSLRAPDGASVVLVTVGFGSGSGADSVGLLPGTTPLPTEMSLSADERDVELRAPYTIAAGAPQPRPYSEWVIVPGDGSDLVLRVEFDGLTQSIDLATGEKDLGVAAAFDALDDSRLAEEAACPADGWSSPDRPGRSARVDCTVAVTGVLPWAPGVGWAEVGEGWRLVSADVAVLDVGGAPAPQSGAGTALAGRLDGEEPVDSVVQTPSSSAPGAAAVRWVFPTTSGSAGSLDLEVSYSATDPEQQVSLRTTVSVDAP